MTSRSGGRIAPDGRSPKPKGVGKRARRHDLERPKTPGLHGSDLQQGDIQALEQGQRVRPLKKQNQGAAQNRRRKQPLPARTRQTGTTGGDVPDPVAFLGDRLAGTLQPGAPSGLASERPDLSLLPLMQHLATQTGASGLVSQMYISAVSALRRAPAGVNTPIIDMADADDDLLRAVGG